MRHKADGTPLVVIAGKEYGTGSSRDWAAKGTNLLGVRAVIAESFERIHRSNLVGMGVLPLQFTDGVTRADARADRRRDASRSTASPTSARARTSRSKLTRADGSTETLRPRVPDRYRQRAGIFPQRRHPALRAAQAGGLGTKSGAVPELPHSSRRKTSRPLKGRAGNGWLMQGPCRNGVSAAYQCVASARGRA